MPANATKVVSDIPAAHVKLLSEADVKALNDLANEVDLREEENQVWLLSWIEETPELVPEGATATDVALEYLLSNRHLVASEISPVIKCDPDIDRARRTHLVIEASKYRTEEIRQKRIKLEFMAPAMAS